MVLGLGLRLTLGLRLGLKLGSAWAWAVRAARRHPGELSTPWLGLGLGLGCGVTPVSCASSRPSSTKLVEEYCVFSPGVNLRLPVATQDWRGSGPAAGVGVEAGEVGGYGGGGGEGEGYESELERSSGTDRHRVGCRGQGRGWGPATQGARTWLISPAGPQSCVGLA